MKINQRAELDKYIYFIGEFRFKNPYISEKIQEYNAKFKEENNVFVKENFTSIEDVKFYTITNN